MRQDIQTHLAHSYLLGTLNPEQADQLEELYFVDPLVFRQIKQAEELLISNYLDGRLHGKELEQFEARYLHIPELQRAVAEVRERRTLAAVSVRRRNLFIGLGCAASLALGGWIYTANRDSMPTDTLAFALSPGITKAGSGANISIPSRAQQLRLDLELPGDRPAAPLAARLVQIGADGNRTPVQPDPTISPSTASASGQKLSVMVKASALVTGDYLMQLVDSSGDVRESYLFRIIPEAR